MFNHGNNNNNNTPRNVFKKNLIKIYIFHTLRQKMEK